MYSFKDLMTKLNGIKSSIISNMVYDNDDQEENLEFKKHLHLTKVWFTKISFTNKKQYLLALLRDVNSAWTISLVLKSIWNCQTKDAYMSAYEKVTLSPYDQVPLDHNRTAMPEAALARTMLNDRKWFNELNPENQATVLLDLLTVSGGPILREVFNKARAIYEKYRQDQLDTIESVVPHTDKKEKDKTKIDLRDKTPAEKELESQHATWNSVIKSFRDSLKFEELEVNLVDGTRKKVWKINRPKPETLETVDYLQFIPSPIAKRILSYVPQSQMSECSKVNKYWASLIEDMKSENSTRAKIDADLLKLKAQIESNNALLEPENTSDDGFSSAEVSPHQSVATLPLLVKKKKRNTACKPIRGVKEINEKLDRRGAVDENLFNWCREILKVTEKTSFNDYKEHTSQEESGNLGIHIPLSSALTQDPIHCNKVVENVTINHEALPPSKTTPTAASSTMNKMDMTSVYPVYKILSHQWPLPGERKPTPLP